MMKEETKQFIKEHENDIELLRWGITASITTLIHSDCISRMKEIYEPKRRLHIPTMGNLKSVINDPLFISMIKTNMISTLTNDQYYERFKTELSILTETEQIQDVLNDYIIPNIQCNIPKAIEQRFGLMENQQQQIYREDQDLELFGGIPIGESQFAFICHEAILWYIYLCPSIQFVRTMFNGIIRLHANEVLLFDNSIGICPILIDLEVIKNNVSNSLFQSINYFKIRINPERLAHFTTYTMLKGEGFLLDFS